MRWLFQNVCWFLLFLCWLQKNSSANFLCVPMLSLALNISWRIRDCLLPSTYPTEKWIENVKKLNQSSRYKNQTILLGHIYIHKVSLACRSVFLLGSFVCSMKLLKWIINLLLAIPLDHTRNFRTNFVPASYEYEEKQSRHSGHFIPNVVDFIELKLKLFDSSSTLRHELEIICFVLLWPLSILQSVLSI